MQAAPYSYHLNVVLTWTHLFFSQIVDGKGHLLGRLASVIAKEILNGQKVTVVRCEEINVSGSFFRNKVSNRRFTRENLGWVQRVFPSANGKTGKGIGHGPRTVTTIKSSLPGIGSV